MNNKEQPKEPNKFSYDDTSTFMVGSSMDCTGLIPFAPLTEEQEEAYDEIYKFRAHSKNHGGRDDPPTQLADHAHQSTHTQPVSHTHKGGHTDQSGQTHKGGGTHQNGSARQSGYTQQTNRTLHGNLAKIDPQGRDAFFCNSYLPKTESRQYGFETLPGSEADLKSARNHFKEDQPGLS